VAGLSRGCRRNRSRSGWAHAAGGSARCGAARGGAAGRPLPPEAPRGAQRRMEGRWGRFPSAPPRLYSPVTSTSSPWSFDPADHRLIRPRPSPRPQPPKRGLQGRSEAPISSCSQGRASKRQTPRLLRPRR